MAKKFDDSQLRHNKLGFLEVINPPSPEELKTYYAERYYQNEQGNYRKAYSEQELAYINLKVAQKANLVNHLRGNKDPGTFLDVGCGEGFDLAWFSSAGWSVEGIDYSVAGLKNMNPDLIAYVESGDILDILESHIKAGKNYDLIWLKNVLEHVIAPTELLKTLHSLVKPNSLLVVTVPNDGSAYQESLLDSNDIAERFWVSIPDHLSYFTEDSLKQTTEATGWKCREIIADFPIDFFILHPGSNYVRDRSQGHFAHQARIRMELMLGNSYSHEKVNDFYSALANVGLGRNLTAFLAPQKRQNNELQKNGQK